MEAYRETANDRTREKLGMIYLATAAGMGSKAAGEQIQSLMKDKNVG